MKEHATSPGLPMQAWHLQGRISDVEILNLRLRANIYCMSWALEVLRQMRHGPFSERARCSCALPGNSSLGGSRGSLSPSVEGPPRMLRQRLWQEMLSEHRPRKPPPAPCPARLCLPPAALTAACLPTSSWVVTHPTHDDAPWRRNCSSRRPVPRSAPSLHEMLTKLPIEQINEEQPRAPGASAHIVSSNSRGHPIKSKPPSSFGEEARRGKGRVRGPLDTGREPGHAGFYSSKCNKALRSRHSIPPKSAAPTPTPP